MAGMRALGRVYDQVSAPAATAITVALKDVSGVGILAVAGATAGATLTLTASQTAGGTFVPVQPSGGFGNPNTWFSRSNSNGTVGWVANTASWTGGVLTIAAVNGGSSYVDFLVSELADTFAYLKILGGAAQTCTVTLYDLLVQREPPNLRVPGV